MSDDLRFFVTAAKGTEPALRDELKWLRFRGVRADRGGVHFVGDYAEAMRCAFWTRVGVRVLHPIGDFPCFDERMLYDGVRALDWKRYLDPKRTLAVNAIVRDSRLTHSGATALKTKDAVVDVMRDAFGSRPDVAREDPDVAITVRLVKDHAEVYLDIGGGALHQRGYRARAMEAPLKENLAAALLWMAKWDQRVPLADPMCGSGTIAIEAASWALRIAPGLSRTRFGIDRWTLWDESLAASLASIREDALARRRPNEEAPVIFGSDNEPEAIEVARANAEKAGVPVHFEVADVVRFKGVSEPCVVVSNPPYGVRLESRDSLTSAVAYVLDSRREDRFGLLLGDDSIARAAKRRYTTVREVSNGDLECYFTVWESQADAVPRAGEAHGRARRSRG